MYRPTPQKSTPICDDNRSHHAGSGIEAAIGVANRAVARPVQPGATVSCFNEARTILAAAA